LFILVVVSRYLLHGGQLDEFLARAESGDVEYVRAQLQAGTDPDAITAYDGTTALMFAAYGGHVDIAELLFAHGAEVDKKANFGETALMHAALGGHVEMAQWLLDHGAEVNAQDNGGKTALMGAALGDHVEMVTFLIGQGADVKAKTDSGLSALVVATKKGDEAISDLLRKHGAVE
jgi:ankyrin repeat protein